MEFIKQKTEKTVKIAASAFTLSGFEDGEAMDVHCRQDAVVILKHKMTAMELIHAAHQLDELSTELVTKLALVCGSCDGCVDGCPYRDKDLGYTELPEHLRSAAGIPADAKLLAVPDADSESVIITRADYENDLRDVPPEMLDWLAEIKVCLGELEDHLKAGDLICGSREA